MSDNPTTRQFKNAQLKPDPLPITLPAGSKTIRGHVADGIPALVNGEYKTEWRYGGRLNIFCFSPDVIDWKHHNKLKGDK